MNIPPGKHRSRKAGAVQFDQWRKHVGRQARFYFRYFRTNRSSFWRVSGRYALRLGDQCSWQAPPHNHSSLRDKVPCQVGDGLLGNLRITVEHSDDCFNTDWFLFQMPHIVIGDMRHDGVAQLGLTRQEGFRGGGHPDQ